MVATKICVSLVESASEEKKIAATESGILPALKTIIDDPPPPPPSPKVVGFGPGNEVTPENIPLPDSPSPINNTLTEGPNSPPRADIDEKVPDDGTAVFKTSSTFTGTEATTDSTESATPEQSSVKGAGNSAANGATVPISQFDTSLQDMPTEVTKLAPKREEGKTDDIHTMGLPEGSEPADHFPVARSGTPKVPRSPRAKGVTFDSVDQVILVDTTSYPDDDEPNEPELLTGSPRTMHEPSLHDTPRSKESSDRSKATAEALARQEAKNKEEIYQQAITALDYIITDLPKDALDTVGEAYVTAGIHESLIKALEE